jgi:hypothetical protein
MAENTSESSATPMPRGVGALMHHVRTHKIGTVLDFGTCQENPYLIRSIPPTLYLRNFLQNGEQKPPNLMLNTIIKAPQL